jgi:hypothetical protein
MNKEIFFMMLTKTLNIDVVMSTIDYVFLNGKLKPQHTKVFLDESCCHTNHNTGKTWTSVCSVVNEKGRRSMMVVFSISVMYTIGHERGAKNYNGVYQSTTSKR